MGFLISDTHWGTTNRVWYCEVHDSLVRHFSAAHLDNPQCDWAIAMAVPSWYETCTMEIFELTKLVDA